MKRRLRKFGKRLKSPTFEKIAGELKAPGEVGRAVPGIQQAQMRAGTTNDVLGGDAAIPAARGRTEISTYQTRDTGTQLLYQAEGWVRLRLMLETAGPVSVGTRDVLTPVSSGKGILLPTDVEITFPVAKGGRITIAATAVNRVRYIIEPIPWLEQIALMLGSVVKLLRRGTL